MIISIDSLSYDELVALNHQQVESLKYLDSMHTHEEIACEAVGTIEVKGFHHTIQTYRVMLSDVTASFCLKIG